MTDDWEEAVELALRHRVEVQGQEICLFKRSLVPIECWIEFRGERVNSPFCPDVFLVKSSKREDYVKDFLTAIARKT